MPLILIADDSFPLRLLLRRVLSLQGHQVIEAPDGNRAYDLLLEERPDIAILDIVMPGQSGLEICRVVRENPRLRSIGLIVISANLSEDDALAAGADFFLGKPFRPPQLLGAVSQVLADRQAARPGYSY